MEYLVPSYLIQTFIFPGLLTLVTMNFKCIKNNWHRTKVFKMKSVTRIETILVPIEDYHLFCSLNEKYFIKVLPRKDYFKFHIELLVNSM